MNVDPACEVDKIRMNVLTAWEFYMKKAGYLEKLGKYMTDILIHVISMNENCTK